MPPALALAARVALVLIRDCAMPRARRCMITCDACARACGSLGFPTIADPSPIVPVVLGSEERAVEVARKLESMRIYAPAIRPPTVPPGTSRLRLSVRADHHARTYRPARTRTGEDASLLRNRYRHRRRKDARHRGARACAQERRHHADDRQARADRACAGHARRRRARRQARRCAFARTCALRESGGPVVGRACVRPARSPRKRTGRGGCAHR